MGHSPYSGGDPSSVPRMSAPLAFASAGATAPAPRFVAAFETSLVSFPATSRTLAVTVISSAPVPAASVTFTVLPVTAVPVTAASAPLTLTDTAVTDPIASSKTSEIVAPTSLALVSVGGIASAGGGGGPGGGGGGRGGGGGA